MKAFKFDLVLQNSRWQKDTFVTLNDTGRIENISTEKPVDIDIEEVKGYCLPGFQNSHSHAFQYAMAGLAEIHPNSSKSDDFWSWRETMYKIALSINPDQLEAIATMLYAEMLRHGYTHVAEFHYLHHDKEGKHFENKSEMGERLLSAAQNAGINITLVPMFYQKGGFGISAQPQQRRFISKDLDGYLSLMEASSRSVAKFEFAKLGQGFHSLRAVDDENIRAFFEQNLGDISFHIHIAEQLKEVDECIAYYGKRPVEWLLENTPVDNDFHLIHATHLTDQETIGIARSGAYVVLCPSTEGNLGDGFFPLKKYQEVGGKWSLGTDSHVGLSPMEELRILDYGQRLTTHHRNQIISKTNGDSGHFGYDMALLSGRAAMGDLTNDYFKVGESFNAIVIDSGHPLIGTSQLKTLLSTLIYTGDSSFLLGTITNGDWMVKYNRHLHFKKFTSNFKKVMSTLKIR
ncbi:MAG: formimidoylglutamate deiminase [Cytophagales bacterium]|nr:formimidoylglutamate deiminase [Cytophagales bacterium]